MNSDASLIKDRLSLVRGAMHRHDVGMFVVPSSDPHLSEYPAQRWKSRAWLSGFTGSVGTLVVGSKIAALFVDGRYWTQAEREVSDSGIDLVKVPVGSTTHYMDWIARMGSAGALVAFDGQVMSLSSAQELRRRLDAVGMRMREDLDVVGEVWDSERPVLPANPLFEHVAPYALTPRKEKIEAIRLAMMQYGATHHLVSTLDDVAWITNLRGSDVTYNPVFIAHLLVQMHEATLFVGAGKVDKNLRERLLFDGIKTIPYEMASGTLSALPPTSRLLVDARRVTSGLVREVPTGVQVVDHTNPSTLIKSRKTMAERNQIREVMNQDGAAMCEFYAWLERALERGERVSEVLVHERMAEARSRRPGFIGLSFNTVAAFNANGAMPHYQPTPSSDAMIEGDGLLLIDSGGQYLGGTTDITRVWPIGRITAAHRRDFTLVLKGMMNLSRARFPRGTPSPMLDSIARAPLWAEGLDFDHGTGHGVGYFLNVHEGPQSISRVVPDASMAMEAGMITSIEPGVYRPGMWGVRIENLVFAHLAKTPEDDAFGEMLEFETLTMCPIDTRCVDAALMSKSDVDWLDRYNADVRRRLEPFVAGDALRWLLARTEPFEAA